jgi:hypothetical protein
MSKIEFFSDVVYKYFREDKILYFHSSDAHHNIEGDTYLKYVYNSSFEFLRTELWIGGTNGEMCIRVCSTPKELENLIKAIIY